jgi:hypothetical protein
MKEFVMLFKNSAPAEGPAPSPEQMQQMLTGWMTWFEELGKAGHIVNGGNRLSMQMGRTIKPGGIVSDGPFSEIKEFISGYTIIKAENLEGAVEIAKGCPGLKVGGSVEVRQIVSAEDNS